MYNRKKKVKEEEDKRDRDSLSEKVIFKQNLKNVRM